MPNEPKVDWDATKPKLKMTPGQALSEVVRLEKQLAELKGQKARILSEILEPHVKKAGEFGVQVDGEEWRAVMETDGGRTATMKALQEILGVKEGERIWKKLPVKKNKNLRVRKVEPAKVKEGGL